MILICSVSLRSYSQRAFYDLGKSYADEGDYLEAIRLTKKCLEWDCKNIDKLDLFLDFCSLSEYYSYITEADSCERYADKAIGIWEEVKGLEYSAVLSNLSHSLFRAGITQRAFDYRFSIIDIIKQQYGNESARLLNQYRVLSSFYKKSGDIPNAIEYAKKEEALSFKIRDNKESFDKKITYSESFQYLIYVIQECEDPIVGIHYLLDCLNNHRDAIDEENRKHTLNTIWAISRDNNFIDGCIAVYKDEALYGSYNDQFTNLINLRVEDKNIKNDVNAPRYAQGLYDLVMRKELGKWFNSEEIEHLLITLTDYYGEIGLTRQSFEMAKRNYEWRLEHNLDMFFYDLRVLITCSSLKDEAEYAAEFGEKILQNKRYENDEELLNLIYENLAGAYLRLGRQEKAKVYLSKIGDTDSFDILYSKAGAYLQAEDMKSLLPISLKLNRYKNIPETNRELILWMLMTSARDECNDSILLKYADEYVSTYRQHLLNNIPLMSEEEQSNYLSKSSYNNTLCYDLLIGLEGQNVKWSASKEAYDYTLLRKGVLLMSQQGFRNIIKNCPDSIIRLKWENYQRNSNSLSLENEITKRELIEFAAKQSSYLKQLSYTWKDVKNSLGSREAAVEFVLCYNFKDFSDRECLPMYVALLILPNGNEPITLALSPNEYIHDIISDEYLLSDDSRLYDCLWSPIEPFLKDIDTVYFSPTEDLNSVAMEYVWTGEERICDKRNLIRVSSTREVIDNKKDCRKDNAILYGGLKYDLTQNELIAQSRSGSYHSPKAFRSLSIDKLRYGVEYLPHTLIEVQSISSLFKKAPKVITDINGTEESFKFLQGLPIDIIHLATHGFFWDSHSAQQRNYVNFLHNINVTSTQNHEEAMLRSGLIFSGANIGLKGDRLPDDVEDGVLTAYELSKMNLGQVDLVVMSACESGLGETSGEGVFGLQRGFKLAGANTLLMSLWRVDDEATQQLMTEFYSNYLKGSSKQESLRAAQLSLRNNQRYSDPDYWAGWILLDALD